MEKQIDLSTWKRKEIFDFFSHASNPYYMVTFRIDVAPLYAYVKKHHLSFYYSLVYLCTQAINDVEAFRYTIRGEQVFYLDPRIPSFTDLKKDSKYFHIVTMPTMGSLAEFNEEARKRSAAQQFFLDTSQETDRVIYFSCLPWVDLTALTNERDFSSPRQQKRLHPPHRLGKIRPKRRPPGTWHFYRSKPPSHRWPAHRTVCAEAGKIDWGVVATPPA